MAADPEDDSDVTEIHVHPMDYKKITGRLTREETFPGKLVFPGNEHEVKLVMNLLVRPGYVMKVRDGRRPA